MMKFSRGIGTHNPSLDPETAITRERRTRGRRLGFDALEGRTMLSGAPLKIASLGDSLTDEYEFYPPDRTAAQNWVQILSTLRGGQNGTPDQVDFGAFSSTSRGETRNQGYAQNWARSGATATLYPFDKNKLYLNLTNPYSLKQELDGVDPKKGMDGLLTQPGGVSGLNVVTLLIGGNDFADSVENEILQDKSASQVYVDLFSHIFTDAGLQTNILDPIKSAIKQIEAAAVKDNNPNLDIVLVSTPDVTLTPLAPSAGKDISGIAKLVDTAESKLVTKLDNPHLGFVDINSLFNGFIANPVIDNMYVDPNGAGPLASDLFVGDGFHPGSIAQGILANAIANEIDTKWDPGAITLLTPAEIVNNALENQPVTVASLTPSASTTAQGSAVTFSLTVNPFVAQYPLVTPDQYPFPAPSGNVTFLDSYNGYNIVLGTASLLTTPSASQIAGQTTVSVAKFSTALLPIGVNVITAVYNGNTVYPPASPAPVQVTVVPVGIIMPG
jgi:phospholipase/lecithinase/hemolysin